MRTMRTQFTNLNRLPKQSSLLCANFAGMGYLWAELDNSSISTTSISRPKYDQEYKWKRRT